MARAEREPERLNTPGRRKRSILPRPRWDRDTFGAFAEGFARFMGTARFLAWMTVIIICWVLWNVPFGPPRPRFDEYQSFQLSDRRAQKSIGDGAQAVSFSKRIVDPTCILPFAVEKRVDQHL